MAVFLLQEMSKGDSFWRPYLDVLPKSFGSFPVFYGENEIRMLRGSAFGEILREKKEGIEKDYEEICGFLPEFEEQFSLEAFMKGRMMVSSRVFGIDVNCVKTDALVPFADMLNHHRPPQTSWTFDNVKEGFSIQALDDIPRGAAVLDSYGRKSNSQFLINYGFVDPHSDVEECTVRFHLHPSDPLLAVKRDITNGAVSFTVRLEANSNWREVMGVLRLMECEEEQLLREIATSGKEQHTGNFSPSHVPLLSIPSECRSLLSLKSTCEDLLRRYATTLDQDLSSIETNVTENCRNILVTLVGEKRVLLWYLQFAVTSLHYLQSEGTPGGSSLCEEYIAEVESFLFNC